MMCFSCEDVHEGVRGPLWTAYHRIRTVQRSRSSLRTAVEGWVFLKYLENDCFRKMTPYLREYLYGFYDLYLLLSTHCFPAHPSSPRGCGEG